MTADLCLSHGGGHVTCCARQAQPLHQVSVKKLMVCSGCKMFSVVLNPVDYNKSGPCLLGSMSFKQTGMALTEFMYIFAIKQGH